MNDLFRSTLLALNAAFPVEPTPSGSNFLKYPSATAASERTESVGEPDPAGLQPEVCEDCGGTGLRPRNIDGCDVECACWCEAGDHHETE